MTQRRITHRLAATALATALFALGAAPAMAQTQTPPPPASAAQSWNWTAPLCPAPRGSIPITCSSALARIAAGSSGLASLRVETISARAPESSRIC